MMEAFTGYKFDADAMITNGHFNHPQNGFNLEVNAHDAFDELKWGIEATVVDNGMVNGLHRLPKSWAKF